MMVLFAEASKSRNLQLMVISLRPNVTNSLFPAQLESLGVRVVTLSIHNLYNLSAIPTLVRIFRREKFDVVQTHLEHSNILGTLAGRLTGIPIVATLHTTQVRPVGRFHGLRRVAEKYALRYGARRVVAVGHRIADSYRQKIGRKEIDVIPSAVKSGALLSSEERLALRQKLTGDPNRPLILSVGRLMIDKGYADLLTGFAQARQRYPEAFLVVIGEGELRNDLESRVASLGLTDHVRFLGARDNVPNLLAAGDIYVNSSHREGLSMAILEAMAAGLPVLATKVGDAEYLLADGRGVMIEPHDPTALAAAMCALLDQPKTMLMLGKAAQAFTEKRYTLGQWLESFLRVYAWTQNGLQGEKVFGL